MLHRAPIWLRCRVLPIDQIGSILVVVTPDIGNEEALAEVRRTTGSVVTPIQCSEDGFDGIVADYYKRLADSGLQPVVAMTSSGPGVTTAPKKAGPANGVVRAIPVGPPGEDAFFKRFMSAGPIPAAEAEL